MLPSQCTYWCEWVHKPRFFGERLIDGEWHQFEIKNAQMRSEVENDMLKGRFTIKGVVWKWNIQYLTLFKNEERWLLRVMTPGILVIIKIIKLLLFIFLNSPRT